MRTYRVGVFGRGTAPTDGGADTLLQTLDAKLRATGELAGGLELVPVPWSAWSHRRRPLRYAWGRLVRGFGGELPQVDLRPVCRELRLDLAYFTAPAFARIDIPFVFTVWDLGHRTIPDFPEFRANPRDPWTHREALYGSMLGQASFVVAANATGSAEICGHYGVPRDRVVALPFPNPDFSGETETVPSWLPARPFFLYPAQFWPHKNHVTLIQAIAGFARAGRNAPDLVFTGSDKGNAAHVRALAAKLGVGERVHFPGFVSRGELKALYRRATGLAFPSLLGPSNLPPQEAAVLGCPVILSDLPGHREQLGDGALYVSPFNAAGWGEAMEQLAGDAALRSTLAARARFAVAGCTVDAYVAGVGQLLARTAATRALWGG